MADVKTILRETSVVFGLTCKKVEGISPNSYIDYLSKTLSNFSDVKQEMDKISILDTLHEHNSILKNGFDLGQKIKDKRPKINKIIWLGSYVGMEYPFDLMIDDLGISLKEHSDIIKNPALSDYLNSLTQVNPPFKTIHIFRHFAADLFEDWFQYTFSKLFDSNANGIVFENKKRGHLLVKKDNELHFIDNSKKIVINKKENITELQFNKKVGGKAIEYTFSKWINNVLSSDEEYLKLKKKCSITAGNNFKNFVEKNLKIDKSKILSLFQIYEKKYWYAKVGQPLYEVPSVNDTDVEIVDISVLVPESQLNIHFTFSIKNGKNKSLVYVRVECRYSHGQFKGVPEAKLYLTKSSKIDNLYKQI